MNFPTVIVVDVLTVDTRNDGVRWTRNGEKGARKWRRT